MFWQIWATDPNADLPVVEVRAWTNKKFKTSDTKLHVPVVTLSA